MFAYRFEMLKVSVLSGFVVVGCYGKYGADACCVHAVELHTELLCIVASHTQYNRFAACVGGENGVEHQLFVFLVEHRSLACSAHYNEVVGTVFNQMSGECFQCLYIDGEVFLEGSDHGHTKAFQRIHYFIFGLLK